MPQVLKNTNLVAKLFSVEHVRDGKYNVDLLPRHVICQWLPALSLDVHPQRACMSTCASAVVVGIHLLHRSVSGVDLAERPRTRTARDGNQCSPC